MSVYDNSKTLLFTGGTLPVGGVSAGDVAVEIDRVEATGVIAPVTPFISDNVAAYRQAVGGGTTVAWNATTIQTATGPRNVAARAPHYLLDGYALAANLAGTGDLVSVARAYDATLLGQVKRGEFVILVASTATGLSGELAADLTRAMDRYNSLPALSYHGLGAIEAHAADPSLETGRRTVMVETPGWYPVQPVEDQVTYRVAQASCTVDLTVLPNGRSATVYAVNGCKAFAPTNFAGQAGNLASMPVGSVFRASNIGGTCVIEPIVGTPVYSALTRPAMTRTILWAGQSQVELGFTSGLIGGFTDAIQSGELTGGADATNTHHINAGASNSAATITSSATRYWWGSGVAGPHLTDAIAAINAATAAGQPAPSCMIWKLGETDAPALSQGTTTYANFKAALLSIFGALRAVAPGMQVIVCAPGSNDVPVGFTGMMGVRTAYLELAAENAWIHMGHEMYDLPHPYGNVHLTDQGFYAAGIRDAMVYRAAIHGATVNLGPSITSATRQADGSVRVVIATDATSAFYPPQDAGPYPYGLCIINHAQGMTTAAPVRRGSAVVETGQVVVTLYPVADVTGMRVFTVAGWVNEARRRNYIRDMRLHGRSPGFPVRFGRSAAL